MMATLRRIYLKTGYICNISALLCIVLCFGLSSCSPWESDIDRVCQAAQKGDKNAMFAIIEHEDKFKDKVSPELFKSYLDTLIASGNHEAIIKARLKESAEYRRTHKGMDYERLRKGTDAIDLKWHYIGIKYNDIDSYSNLASHYQVRYRENHQPEDSIRAAEFRQKAWENWHEGTRLRRDIKAGIIPVLKGGVEFGCHVYQTSKHESFIPRLFEAGVFFSEYVLSGLLKLLFTAQWWKVLLTIFVFILVMSIPMIVANRAFGSLSYQRNSMKLGVILGFSNVALISVAYINDNPNWVNNVGALWFPEASYGLQPYLCVIPNLLILFLLFINIAMAIYESIKYGDGFIKGMLSVIGIGLVFIVNYLMAGIVGLFYLFIVIVVFIVTFTITLPSTSTSSVATDSSERNKEKACVFCRYYDNAAEYCGMRDSKQARYGTDAYSCPYYS